MFLHQFHVFLVHEGAVLDRIHAADDGLPAYTFGAVCVRGNRETVVVRRRDDSLDLFQRHLRIVDAGAFVEHTAGWHDLDQVGAVLVVLAHGFPRIFGRIDDALLGTRIAGQISAISIGIVGVATGRADRTAGRVDARTGDDAGIDCIAQRDRIVLRIGEIADGRESRAPACVVRRLSSGSRSRRCSSGTGRCSWSGWFGRSGAYGCRSGPACRSHRAGRCFRHRRRACGLVLLP